MTPDAKGPHGSGGAETPGYGIRGATYGYSAGVPVLRNVHLEFRSGSVHGLVGENGSGKSTVIKLLSGVLQPQVGSLYLDDREFSLSSPAEAYGHGIGVVHQDYNLFPDLSVAQNVLGVGGSLPRRRWSRAIDRARIEHEVENMLRSLGIDLEPDALVRSLDPAERKFVEIVRAMRLRPRFLILDEPTASLQPEASRSVLALVRRLREQGLGVCFVSHRLNEVLDIADEISCLRDGVLVGCVDARGLAEDQLVDMIVGRQEERRRKAEARRHPPRERTGEPILKIRNVRLQPGRPPVDLDLERGEILGLTGLLGSGATTVTRMIGGAQPLRGYIEAEGRRRRIRGPQDANRLGIGFIPEDRKASGAVPELSVAVNLCLPSLKALTKVGVVQYWAMRARAQDYAGRLDVRAASVDVAANTLSGGNLQKVLIAKWLATKARILAIEEPTHGVDIGAKAQVHSLLRKFAADGGSIVVALSEVSEALEFCDRIAIFRHGAVVDVVEADKLTISELTILEASDRLEQLIEGSNGSQFRGTGAA